MLCVVVSSTWDNEGPYLADVEFEQTKIAEGDRFNVTVTIADPLSGFHSCSLSFLGFQSSYGADTFYGDTRMSGDAQSGQYHLQVHSEYWLANWYWPYCHATDKNGNSKYSKLPKYIQVGDSKNFFI